MSGTYVQWASSDALIRRLRDMAAYARPGSRAVARARSDILESMTQAPTVERWGFLTRESP